MDHETTVILLSISGNVLLILWLITIQQLCVSNVSDRKHCRTSFSAAFFGLCAIILNGLMYGSATYPDYRVFYGISLQNVRIVFEAFVSIIGFHCYRHYILQMIDRIYRPINSKTPRWIDRTFMIGEYMTIITILVCYSLEFIYKNSNMKYIRIFYVILGIEVIGYALCIFWALSATLGILNNIQRKNASYSQIQSARNTMKLSITVALIVVIVGIADIALNLQFLLDFVPISLNKTLVDAIMHSAVLVVLVLTMLLGIYRGNCWVISDESVCIVWCCGDFCVYYCCCKGDGFYYDSTGTINKTSKKKKKSILLEESTRTFLEKEGINSQNITPITDVISTVDVSVPTSKNVEERLLFIKSLNADVSVVKK